MNTYRGELFGIQVEIDVDATKLWYGKAELWGCECVHCRNFLELARQKALPLPVLELLDRFGIPPEKATYVCELCPADGGHLYQISYRLAGHMLDEVQNSAAFEWGEARCCHELYPYGAPGFPAPHFDLEFYLTMPRVLVEQEQQDAEARLMALKEKRKRKSNKEQAGV